MRASTSAVPAIAVVGVVLDAIPVIPICLAPSAEFSPIDCSRRLSATSNSIIRGFHTEMLCLGAIREDGAMLNPRQLEAFRAVMLSGGMTPTAELIGVTQPAVSRLIHDLQRA